MSGVRTAEELFEGPDEKPKDGTEAFLDEPARTSDAPALKKAALKRKSAELQEESDILEVLSTPAAIRLMARIITACGWNMPYFNPNNSVMSEVAGRRSIAWQLEQWISDADLSLWFAVRTELEKVRPKPKTSERKKSSAN